MAEPEKFQHYDVLKHADGSLHELGRGAMGVTYKAFDTNLRMHVALKVINSAYLDSEVARQRFLREARAAAGLRHANVASVFHLGDDGECFFYAMEFVDGETVDARLRRQGPIPAAQALEIALQVARALGAAERQRLVHRDLKPANIMLHEGDDGELTVKVIDFGLAKSAGKEGADAATLTQGGFLGTPHFASPEQLEEREVDARSDIYSLGVTLWCMLLGKTPYSGSVAQVMSQHLYKQVPVEQLAGLPAEVVALLRRMLEKDPARRPQSASELRREIETVMRALSAEPPMLVTPGAAEAFLEETMETMAGDGMAEGASPPTVHATPAQGPPPLPAATKPRRLLPLVIALVVLGSAGVGGWLLYEPKSAPAAASVESKPSPAATPVAKPEPPVAPLATPAPTPLPTPDPEAQYQAHLQKAHALGEAGNWSEAITSLVALARLHPGKPEPTQRIDALCGQLIRDESPLEPAAMDPEAFEQIRVPLEDAAHLGIPRAMVLLAQNIRQSDPARALTFFEKAAATGNIAAMRQGGLLYSIRAQPGDMARAVAMFEQGAQLGDVACHYLAGESFLLGKGVAKDVDKGLAYLEQAAAWDEPHALDRLGDYYYKVKKDFPKALAAFERARSLNWAPALANLGVLYVNGAGVAKNETTAAALFREGAEKGDSRAMTLYAQCLEGGVGVPANKAEAVKWYRDAAARGETRAAEWLKKNAPP